MQELKQCILSHASLPNKNNNVYEIFCIYLLMEKEVDISSTSYIVTPWNVSGKVDYDKLIKEFCVEKIGDKIRARLKNAHPLIK